MPFEADDLAPKRRPATHQLGEDLQSLSVEELNERIAQLREEIARLEAAVKAKTSQRSLADQFFKA